MTQSVYEIPMTPGAQRFTVDLQQVTYNVALAWNPDMACWVLDLADAVGNALANGVPLLPGGDMLAQYPHLGVGGSLVAFVDGDPNAVIGYDDLGVGGHLYFVTGTP